MERTYEIAGADDGHLAVGQWVEIFEAYGDAEGTAAIRVRSLRVGGKTLVFGDREGDGARPLRPHEGRIVSVQRGPVKTEFGLRLRS